MQVNPSCNNMHVLSTHFCKKRMSKVLVSIFFRNFPKKNECMVANPCIWYFTMQQCNNVNVGCFHWGGHFFVRCCWYKGKLDWFQVLSFVPQPNEKMGRCSCAKFKHANKSLQRKQKVCFMGFMSPFVCHLARQVMVHGNTQGGGRHPHCSHTPNRGP